MGGSSNNKATKETEAGRTKKNPTLAVKKVKN